MHLRGIHFVGRLSRIREVDLSMPWWRTVLFILLAVVLLPVYLVDIGWQVLRKARGLPPRP